MEKKAAGLPMLIDPDAPEAKRTDVPLWMKIDIGLPLPILSPEEQARQASDPNMVPLTGGRQNSGMYQGQLTGRQREALAAWRETDDYKNAYLKKKKRRRRRPEWVPLSREYQFDAIMRHRDPIQLGKPEPPPTGKPPDPYRSSEFQKETKRASAIPPHEQQKSAYRSLEYQKDYPVPPIPYPGVPLGHSPEEGPWVEVFDSMWNSFWVTLKDREPKELAEAGKKEFLGYDLNSNEIA